ncbi:MAG: hypothetical protein ACFB4J_01975 [Elainellaceae cyanobacterium]
MIISHKHRFIFIKTMKTASTSLEVFLSQHCGDRGVITPIYPPVKPHHAQNYQSGFNPLPELWLRARHRQPLQSTLKDYRTCNRFYNHLPAYAIRARVPRQIWRTYFKFCVERNPWDKTLSYYHMRRYDSKQPLSFKAYLSHGDFCLNYPYYTDLGGDRIIVDRVIHYEALSQGLSDVCQRLDIPFSGTLDIWAKADRRNDYRPYQDIYTPAQRQLIETVFAKEIELHDYRF